MNNVEQPNGKRCNLFQLYDSDDGSSYCEDDESWGSEWEEDFEEEPPANLKEPAPPPVVKEPALVIKETAPVIKEPAPVIIEPAPVIIEPTPVIKEPPPVIKEPTPPPVIVIEPVGLPGVNIIKLFSQNKLECLCVAKFFMPVRFLVVIQEPKRVEHFISHC